jgi:hypothetical protein
MVNGPAGRPPLKLVILLIIGAVGLGLFAVGVTGHTGWTLIVVGLLLLVASIPGLWRIQKARDRLCDSSISPSGVTTFYLPLVLHSSAGEHLATPGVTPELRGLQGTRSPRRRG